MLFKKTCIFNTRFFNEILSRCKSIIGLKESQSVLCQLYCSWWGLSERNRLKENTKQQQQKTNTKTIKQTDKKNVIYCVSWYALSKNWVAALCGFKRAMSPCFPHILRLLLFIGLCLTLCLCHWIFTWNVLLMLVTPRTPNQGGKLRYYANIFENLPCHPYHM